MNLPPPIEKLLSEFEDIFSNEGPIGLPPIRGIEHQIDFILGASLPNRPAYRKKPLGNQGDRITSSRLVGEGLGSKEPKPLCCTCLVGAQKGWKMAHVL